MTIKTRADLDTAIATIDDSGANTASEVRSVLTDIMDSGTNVSSGSGAPASTPEAVGDIYIDTTADTIYIATDTSGSGDWDLLSINGHTHAASAITSGTLAAARISEASVTQHQSALSITESQISDLQSYLLGITGESIADLSDVTVSGPSSGDIFRYNGSAWVDVPGAVSGAGTPTTTATTPDFVNQVYFDTVSNRVYIAEGNSSPSDFTLAEVASSNPSFTGTNNTGDTIDKGQPVSGNESGITAVDSDTASTFPAVGIAGESIADSASGTVITHGVLTGLDTDTPGWSQGDVLYASGDPTTDLGMTNTAPTTGTIQQVAVVMTVDSGTGTILVCPQIVADATITEEIYIAATAFTAGASGGPEATTVDYSTNGRTRSVLAFDATTSEEATVEIAMPTGWDEGTITFIPYWSHPSTTTNFGVVWELSALCIGNDDSLDAAFSGTAQTSTDTGGTTDDLYIGPESSGITVENAAEAEFLTLEIARLPANGSDTMAVDARLHGIKIRFTRNEVSDA